MTAPDLTPPHPVIESLRVQNYRVLRDVELQKLTPLTVLFGPNGSGKSTVFDIFAFLHEALTEGLRHAWDRRNRMDEIRSRGSSGPVAFELAYREDRRSRGDGRNRLVRYRLEITEEAGRPVVEREELRWSVAPAQGRSRQILFFDRGEGKVYDEATGAITTERLESSDLLAVSTLGQLSRHPRVAALRRFISGWYLSYVSADSTRTMPQIGPQERLSRTGDNLPNVIQYLQEQHPDRLDKIFGLLASRVPQLERLVAEPLADGRLMLRLKDRAFDEPVLSRFTSDGTLKLLAYLTLLYDPEPPSIIGIEEPENQLHPRLLYSLAEEARGAAERAQVLVTTHSPHFANALRADELWLIHRERDGYARVVRASTVERVETMSAAGGALGDLWMEGYFGGGDPLVGAGS